MSLLDGTFTSFLLAFSALFSIVNPLAGALIYSQVTANRSPSERVTLAWRVAFYSAVVMIAALWAGAPLLNFFGVGLGALRIRAGSWSPCTPGSYSPSRSSRKTASSYKPHPPA